jgi:NADPH-dependent ferric siderophore reductase
MADMSRMLTASAQIALSSPEDTMLRLCTHFREHGDVSVTGTCARIETGFGIAGMEACDGCLKVHAEGKDDTALAYVKLAIAEHLLHLAAADQPTIVWQGDGAAGQALPYFREMRVVGARSVSPKMRRLTLAGEDLQRFASGGLHVRLLFPKGDRAIPPAWPVTGADGRPQWPNADQRPDVRIYTIRRIDVARGEVDIDFVLHQGSNMPGARFAVQAVPGDVVGMTGPGGGSVGNADWYLLAGDQTAVPAIGRILEELPPRVHAVVRIAIDDPRERQALKSRATLDLQWLVQDTTAADTAPSLSESIRAASWPSDDRSIFVWTGCEFDDFRAIRSYLRTERGLTREQHLVVAYWRRGYDGDNARTNDEH